MKSVRPESKDDVNFTQPIIEELTNITQNLNEHIYFGRQDGLMVDLANYNGPKMANFPAICSCEQQIFDPRVRPWYKSFLLDPLGQELNVTIGEKDDKLICVILIF